MRSLSIEQEKGTRFEIWLELLLKNNNYQNVLRNVTYHKSRYIYRQLDLQYCIIKENRIYNVGVEAKFSSNGNIAFNFRNSKKKKSGQKTTINNIIDEVSERRDFCKLDRMIIVTNKDFDHNICKYSKKEGIDLINGVDLQNIFNKLGYKKNIDDSINSIDIYNFNLNMNRIYIS